MPLGTLSRIGFAMSASGVNVLKRRFIRSEKRNLNQINGKWKRRGIIVEWRALGFDVIIFLCRLDGVRCGLQGNAVGIVLLQRKPEERSDGSKRQMSQSKCMESVVLALV